MKTIRKGPLTIEKVIEIILDSYVPETKNEKAYFIDSVLHPEDSKLEVSGNVYRMASDTIIVFVDDEPGKNWAHDCHYLLFDVRTGEVKKIKEKFPPSLIEIPGTYRAIWKPETLPSWAIW